MSKRNKILLAVFGVIVIFFILNSSQNNSNRSIIQNNSSINKPSVSQKDALSAQKHEGGNVTVIVKPKVLQVDKKPTFEIEFTTHSVELSFDVVKQSYLLDDQDNRFDESVWNGSPPGGHHRSGTLIFNQPLAETDYLDLIFTDIAGIPERRFRWEL